MLVGLDDAALWQDEAETAVLAYNTLIHGYPSVVDEFGNRLLEGGHESNAAGVWTWQTWGQYYIGAASFALLGKTTFAARLPFALLGVLCIPLTWVLARLLFEERRIALLACTLLTGSVPFLLAARQCRNYTLATVCTLLVLITYVRFIRKQSQWGVGVAVALVMLYYTQILLFAGVAAGLLFHFFQFNRKWHEWRRAIPVGLVVFACALPWFLYSGGFDRPGQFSPIALVPHLFKFMVWINNYIFPALLLVVPLRVWCARRAAGQTREKPLFELHNPVVMLGMFVTVGVLVWSMVFWVFFRYLVVFIPPLLILLAVALNTVWTRSRVLAIGVTAVLIVSNGIHIVPVWLAAPIVGSTIQTFHRSAGIWGQMADRLDSVADIVYRRRQPESLVTQFVGELTDGYDGPLEAVAAYLNENAQKGDRIWTNYEELPLLFYNRVGYRVSSYYRNAMDVDGQLLAADWLVPRDVREEVSINGTNYRIAPGRFDLKFKVIREFRFDHDTAFPFVHDRKNENRPDPDTHSFATPAEGETLIIYRRRPEALEATASEP